MTVDTSGLPLPLNIVRVWASIDDTLPRLVIEMPLAGWHANQSIPRSSPLAWGQVPDILLALHRALSDVMQDAGMRQKLRDWAVVEGAPEA